MALITPAQARQGIPALGAGGQDDRLTWLIEAAEGMLAAWCAIPPNVAGEVTFTSSDRIDYVSGPTGADPTEVALRVWPVTDITRITEDSAGDRTYATEISGSTYTLVEASSGLLYRSAGWLYRHKGTRIQYIAGHSPETLDPALRMCIERQVRHLYDSPAFADFADKSGMFFRADRKLTDIAPDIIGTLRRWQRGEALLG